MKNSHIAQLLNKRFSVYVTGEFERQTNFLGLIRLLNDFSDFFRYSTREQTRDIKKWLKEKEIYIDCNMHVKFN